MAKTQKYEGLTEEELNVIKKLKRNNYDNVKVSIVGAWVWVSGDTKPHKNILSKMGLRYSGPKKMWYMTDGKEDGKHNHATHTTIGHAQKFHKTVEVI